MTMPPTPETPPRRPRPDNVPILGLVAALVLVIVGITALRGGDRTTINAGMLPLAGALGDVAQQADELPTATATAIPTAVPTATAVPTTPPIEPVPTSIIETEVSSSGAAALTRPEGLRALPDAAGSDEVAAATAVPTEVPPTPVPPTATAVPPTPIPATATPVPPTPVPTATLVPTATPIPATPTPLPTVPPAPTATPWPTPEIPTATPIPVRSTADMEIWVLGEINAVRAQAGVAPLQLRSDLSNIARDWSSQMAAAGGISHRPAAQLGAMLPTGWKAWGENVATAPSIEWAQSGLEQSSGHYQNMVNPAYNTVGIGVVITGGGQVWLTHNFAGY